MKLKSLAAVVVAGLSLAAFDASACATAAWIQDGNTSGVVGAPIAGEPDDTTPVIRYANRCGLLSTAPNNFVIDGSPTSETTFRARFYVFTGATSPAIIYRARNATPADMIQVRYTPGANGTFDFATSNGVFTSTTGSPIVANRWYSIELNWAAGQAMTATVQGNNAAALPNVTTAAAAAGDRIDSAQLGWISGSTGGSVTVDAYESRRTTAIGRLLKGDANSSSSITIGDATQIITEVNGGALVGGNPECNESGGVTIGDATCVVNIVNGG